MPRLKEQCLEPAPVAGATLGTQPAAVPSQPSAHGFWRCCCWAEAILQPHQALHAAHCALASPKVVPEPCTAFSSPGGHRDDVSELSRGQGTSAVTMGRPHHQSTFHILGIPRCTLGTEQPAGLATAHPAQALPFPVLCCHQVDISFYSAKSCEIRVPFPWV